MFTIDLPTSTDTSKGAFIGVVGAPSGACLGAIEPVASPLDEAGAATTTTVTLIDGTTADYEVYVPVGDVGAIATVTANDIPYTLASGPPTAADPLESKEYWHDPYTNQVILGSTPVGNSVRIRARQQVSVKRDRICNPPNIFRLLSITETLEITTSLGGHPSGSFPVKGRLQNIRALRQALAIGTAIDIMGIGFRVTGLSMDESRHAISNEFTLNVTLGGKWEAPANDAIAWRDSVSQLTDENGLLIAPNLSGGPNSDTDTDTTAPIKTFADRASIPYQGVDLTVTVAGDTTSEDSTTFASLLTRQRAATEGRFIDWSSPSGVATPSIDQVGSWSFGPTEIFQPKTTVDYSGIGDRTSFTPTSDLLIPAPDATLFGTQAKPTLQLQDEPDVSGYAVEYPNMLLTGQFSEPGTEDETEDSQGDSENEAPPAWKRREPIIQTFTEGDQNVTQPPSNAKTIRDLSVLFSVSGVTKIRTKTTKQNGVTILIKQEKYGFAFAAEDVATTNADGSYKISATPSTYWKKLENITQPFLFDQKTGYGLGSDTSGTIKTRYKEESEQNPETLDSELSDDEKELYRYFDIPVTGAERIVLRRHQDYYSDVRNSDRYEYYQVTLPNGEAAFRRVENPNFVPPMFVAAIASESSAFAETDNPNPTGDDKREKLFTGREDNFSSTITVQSGSDRIISSGDVDAEREAELAALDRYTEFSVANSNQGEGFKDYAADKKFRDFSGRPGIADRLPTTFDRVPPESNEPPPNDESEDGFTKRYFVRSTGYTSSSPIGGSISVPTAKTREQAETAVLTLSYLDQLQNGDTDTIEVPFNEGYRPGDRFTYISLGERRQRRILSVKWRMTVISPGVIRGRCLLTLGRDLDPRSTISFDSDRIPNPSNEQDSLDDGTLNEFTDTIVRRPGFELGSLLGTNVKGRLG